MSGLPPLVGAALGVGSYLAAAQQAAKDEEQRRLDEANRAAILAGVGQTQAQTGYEQEQAKALQREAGFAGRNYGLRSNWSTLPPERQVDALNAAAVEAQQAGDTASAARYSAMASDIALAQQRFGQAGYEQARIWDLRTEQPREFQAKMAQARMLAQQRWKSQYQIELLRAQSAANVAGIRGQDAIDVANLALARAQSTAELRAATDYAIAEYKGQVSEYTAEAGALPAGTTPQEAGLTPPTMPPVNYNFYYGAGGGDTSWSAGGSGGQILAKAPAGLKAGQRVTSSRGRVGWVWPDGMIHSVPPTP